MAAADWYRNEEWTPSIAAHFEKKLQRARRKEQYLRIQASTLAGTNPEVALSLLERYFALPYDFDHAQAYVDRANAFLALGRKQEAVASYEAALQRESAFPRLLTQAYVDLPFLIALHEFQDKFSEALELLEKHRSRLMFPVDHFKWHAAKALICAAKGHREAATANAKLALEHAARDGSGFLHHPKVGLVTAQHNDILDRLRGYCDA